MPLYVGAVGIALRLTVYENGAAKDISTASLKQIKIRKPDGEVITKTASFVTDGTNGQLQVATDSDDLDQEGRYTYCANLTIGSVTSPTSPVAFIVEIAP